MDPGRRIIDAFFCRKEDDRIRVFPVRIDFAVSG